MINEEEVKEEASSRKIFALTYSLGLPYKIESDKYVVRNISNFKSEEDLIKNLKAFYESKEINKVYLIEADYLKDREHINFIKFVVDKVEMEWLSST